MAHGAGYAAAGGVPPPPLHHLPPPPPPAMYAPGAELLWKSRFPQPPHLASVHQHQHHHHAAAAAVHHEYIASLDPHRDRHDRLLRGEAGGSPALPSSLTYYDTAAAKLRDYRLATNAPTPPRDRREQEQRELLEKQQKEKEREREKAEREREERERTREDAKLVQNDSTNKLLQLHFAESLRIANEKHRDRERISSWTSVGIIHNLPPSGGAVNATREHDRLRAPDPRERYFPAPAPRAAAPPPPAHNRVHKPQTSQHNTQHNTQHSTPHGAQHSTQHHSLPKAEPNFAPYHHYYRPPAYDKKDAPHLPAPPPLVQEPNNSVIVKHDAKADPKHPPYKRGGESHYASRQAFRPALPPQPPHAALPPHDSHRPRAYRSAPTPPRTSAFYVTASSPHRPKVSSPAPSHMYGKPSPDQPYPPPAAYSPAPRQLPPPPPAHAPRVPQGGAPRSDEPCQTEPLDLGVAPRDDPGRSPRRRSPAALASQPLEVKRRRLDSEPAGAAAAVSLGSDPAPQAPGPPCEVRVPSADGSIETPEKAAGASPACVTPASSPPAPTPPQPEKTNSPAPAPSPGPPVRHLGKKAWLQRHETAPASDRDRSGGGGVCVTLPMALAKETSPEDTKRASPAPEPSPAPTPTPAPAESVLHRVGSMAVNSIGRTKTPKARKPTKETNGRRTEDDARDGEDSSSSEREEKTAPPKRKPPKTKRRKGNGGRKAADEPKKKKASESGSDSDKESEGDKDSDSGSGGGARRGGRARGRRARGTGGGRGSGGGRRRDDPPARRSSAKPRRNGESFLQDGNCSEVAPRLAKCRECRWSPQQRDKDMPNIFCRFYAFRRLRYAKNGQLAIAGFSDPYKDAEEEDKKLWVSCVDGAELDVDMSCFLLREIGDQFCELLQQERQAETDYLLGSQPAVDDKTIAWKRVVQGVREICDVCETTLFNLHWTCTKCGFVVCLDCYKSRSSGENTPANPPSDVSERDAHGWLTCTSSSGAHLPRKLILTQIAAGDALATIAARAHETRALWGLPSCRACTNKISVDQNKAAVARKLLKAAISQNVKKEEIKDEATNGSSPAKPENGISLSWLSNASVKCELSGESSTSSDSEEGGYSTLRELLVRPASDEQQPPKKKHKKSKDVLEDVISSVVEPQEKKVECDGKPLALQDFVKKRYARGREELSVRILTLTESRVLYPGVPHDWLCDGKLLHLTDPTHPDNYKPFQDQWKRGQPVLVSDLLTLLNKDLWTPESFSRDFGETRTDLVNCASGLVVPNQPAAKFWDGFAHASRRLRDDRGAPMVLKLKDWPPGEDFAELLPSRFADLMNALPLREYTARQGRLNLAARLPECFVRPDLGPKMYTAYGGAGGTTNLHLDVSDAVNVMVHASTPADAPERAREAARAAEEAGADVVSRRRARSQPAGALWHIYAARDADKIRDLLLAAELERGGRARAHNDPVHDQTWYLDAALRERLYREYGVEGYAVLQCPGDAVFVPAGAPHQVRNLLDCIKVAEDFVSPENVSRCFELAHQFRKLSRHHTNKEDKLQIKNIVYHAVKDSLCCLEDALKAADS